MAKANLPSIQWYPGDWRKDPGVQSLSYEDRGIWFELLMLMHESDNRGKLTLNGKPFPLPNLAQLLGIEQAKLQQTLSTLVSNGVASVEQDTEIVYNRRMLKDEELRQARRKAGRAGGKQSSSKRQANAKQNPTPSSSSSSSSSPTQTGLTRNGPVNGRPLTAKDRDDAEYLEGLLGPEELKRAEKLYADKAHPWSYIISVLDGLAGGDDALPSPEKRPWNRPDLRTSIEEPSMPNPVPSLEQWRAEQRRRKAEASNG